MRQKQFSKNNVLALLNKAKRRFRLMIAADVQAEVLVRFYERMREAREDLKRRNDRTIQICMKTFNVNVFIEKECYFEFRFR